MARIQQFADDLGITYKEAKRLIQMGRNTSDSGSNALNAARERIKKREDKMKKNEKKADQIASEDTNMPLKAKKGKSVEITGPKARPNAEDRFQLEGGFDHDAYKKSLEREEKLERYMEKAPKRSAKLERRGDDKKVVRAAKGTYNTHDGSCGCDMCGGEMVRGMGKAYQGNPRAAKIR